MEYPKPIIEINEYGIKRYGLNGKRHRLDGPIEWSDRTKGWWINGNLHREDGLALEFSDGSRAWYINDKPIVKSEQERHLHNETLKLGSITQFIDFVARCDILLL